MFAEVCYYYVESFI